MQATEAEQCDKREITAADVTAQVNTIIVFTYYLHFAVFWAQFAEYVIWQVSNTWALEEIVVVLELFPTVQRRKQDMVDVW